MGSPQAPTGAKFYYYARSMPVVWFFGLLELGCIVGIYNYPHNFYLWLAALFVIMLSINVSSLTVAMDDETIYIIYGIGLFQKKVEIHSIETLGMSPNNSFQSIYDLGAETALRVIDRDGRKSTIGIGDTRGMLDYLRTKVRG